VTVQDIGIHAEYVSSGMGRFLWCILLVLALGGFRLHAEGQQPPAMPWLKLDGLSATRDRPLFAPDRRQPAPAAVATTPIQPASLPQESQRPQLTLMGIIEAPTATIILLRDRKTSQPLTVRSGDSIGNWRILADGLYTVKLKNGKEEIGLEMFAEP
jgi:hypothetical protein